MHALSVKRNITFALYLQPSPKSLRAGGQEDRLARRLQSRLDAEHGRPRQALEPPSGDTGTLLSIIPVFRKTVRNFPVLLFPTFQFREIPNESLGKRNFCNMNWLAAIIWNSINSEIN